MTPRDHVARAVIALREWGYAPQERALERMWDWLPSPARNWHALARLYVERPDWREQGPPAR